MIARLPHHRIRTAWATACALAVACLAGGISHADTLPLQDGALVSMPTIEVLSSSDTEILVSFEVPALAVERYVLEGEAFHTVSIEGGQLRGENGEPALPAFTRLVAIPARAGVEASVLASEEEQFSGYRVFPMQPLESDEFVLDEAVYGRDAFIGGEPVVVGTPGIMRDLRVVSVTFQPVTFNPARGEIRVARRMEVRLDLTGEDPTNTLERSPRPVTATFDRLYRSMVVNYDEFLGDRAGVIAPHMGTWVIISRDYSTVLAELEPLIEWRERMGYNVVQVTTSETGTYPNSIRGWLQDAYDTWEYPPEHIVIVGDASDGSFDIGTFQEPWYGGRGDHPYSQLDGDDLYPDAFTGRLSAANTGQLAVIIDKITSYEADPLMTDQDWFSSACLVGDPAHSGITCVQIQQWVKEKILTLGYTGVDTVWSYPFVSQMSSSLNDGVSYFGYRGYWGMSGWDTGDIYSLYNTRKLPFTVNLTCGTGTFYSGTSINEAWLRAGSVGNPRGGIGSIATATLGTHTRYNNCFYSGVAFGLFWEDHYQIGVAQARGKLEMISSYGDYQYDQAGRYCYWNTLMGDPATDMWTGLPQTLVVGYPPSVATGANMVSVTVRSDDFVPTPNAWVYLLKEGQITVGGYTDSQGRVDLPIDTSSPGTVLVTVTGHNLYPHAGSFEIEQMPTFVGLVGQIIDDDDLGGSHGNNDGTVNPGETIQMLVTLRNFGYQNANDVVLTAQCDDPYVNLTEAGPIMFGDIYAGTEVTAYTPITFRLSPASPPGRMLHFDLTATAGLDSWDSMLDLATGGPDLEYMSHGLGGVGSTLDPGETGTLNVTLLNVGHYAAAGPISATLICYDYAVQVTDPYATFEMSIAPEMSGSNFTDPFGIRAPHGCVPGLLANLRIGLVFADGVRDTVGFTLEVGQSDSHDPTGPDAYGYLAFDHTDTGYSQAPVYNWIEINPNGGGPGVSVGLSDFGYNQDDSETLDLPFTFQFYGQSFDRVTICSNGWLAMGETYLTNYRNWHLPSAGGPAYMLCPFWDNLYQSSSGRVYHWFDEAQHRYVIAWDNVRNIYGNANESFEVILYDPEYYPTITGDGEIVFQYEDVNNSDSQQMYSTVGIQDYEHTTGITFNYFNQRPSTAASLSDGLAIKFTTQRPGWADVPRGGNALRVVLDQNTPNPVSGGTAIRFRLGQPQPAALRIYDVDGHLVRTLAAGAMTGGQHVVNWQGRDDQGRQVPSGIYFYRLDAGADSHMRKMLVVR